MSHVLLAVRTSFALLLCELMYPKLQQSQQWFLWKPLCTTSCCPCEGCRRTEKNHLVHSCCSLHAPLLGFPYLFSLLVGITLPAAPRSPVAISEAIMMFQLLCQLSTLCGKVSLGEISVGIRTNTLRPACLPLIYSWCFQPGEPELMQNGLGCREPQLPE